MTGATNAGVNFDSSDNRVEQATNTFAQYSSSGYHYRTVQTIEYIGLSASLIED
jgi:hypothetical protein